MEIMILSLRPLPAANGGWSSVKWRTPKLAAPVTVRPIQVGDWLASISPQTRAELGEILHAPFVAGLRLEGPATAFELAIAYAGVVAEACAGVVVLGGELIADRRASVEVWSGPQIEERWRSIDDAAARAEPDYQVRDVNDDHRPTQSFTFPLVIDGLEITRPHAQVPVAVPASAPPERRAAGSEPFTTTASSVRIPARTGTGQEPPAPVTARAPTATGERRARQMKAQFDATAGEQTHDAAKPSIEDDWSDVMPD